MIFEILGAIAIVIFVFMIVGAIRNRRALDYKEKEIFNKKIEKL